jgi:hypothetical protein
MEKLRKAISYQLSAKRNPRDASSGRKSIPRVLRRQG